jgi:hypothetical protein
MQRDERSLGELFSDLSSGMGALVRDEVQLAKTEMTQKATQVGKDVGIIAAGGSLAYAGLLAVIAGIIALLATQIALWQAALIVGIIVLAIGGGIAYMGLNAVKKSNLAPKETIETIKEDLQWAKQQTQ